MKDLAVFTALNHSGSFGKNFFKFQKNDGNIFTTSVTVFHHTDFPEMILEMTDDY